MLCVLTIRPELCGKRGLANSAFEKLPVCNLHFALYKFSDCYIHAWERVIISANSCLALRQNMLLHTDACRVLVDCVLQQEHSDDKTKLVMYWYL